MDALILGISGIKRKESNYGIAFYRYVRVEDVETKKQYLIRLTIKGFNDIVDANGTKLNDDDGYVRMKTGDLANIDHFKNGSFQLDDGAEMLFNPAIFTVLSHETKETTQRYYLNQMAFHDWGVILQNKQSKVTVQEDRWYQMTNVATNFKLNKIRDELLKDDVNKEAFVEITFNAKVYYAWSKDRPFYLGNGDWRITQENLMPLKKVVTDMEEARKMRDFIRNVKVIISRNFTIEDSEIAKLLQDVGLSMTLDDAKDYMTSSFWRGSYDKDFFDFLKKRAKKVSIADEGFIFELQYGIVILEEPEYAKATYIFCGETTDIISKIRGIRSAEPNNLWKRPIAKYKEEFPEKFNWFIGKVIHLDLEQWEEELSKFLSENKA